MSFCILMLSLFVMLWGGIGYGIYYGIYFGNTLTITHLDKNFKYNNFCIIIRRYFEIM